MVELASYLFWTGLALAAIASATYVAHVASASLSLRRLSAQTDAGTVTLSGATGYAERGHRAAGDHVRGADGDGAHGCR